MVERKRRQPAKKDTKTFIQLLSSAWRILTHESLVRATTIGGFVVGASALMVSARSDDDQAKLAREIRADNSWEAYMELAMENPKFAEGTDYNKLSDVDKIRYSWFAERLFYTAESVLYIEPDDPQWKSVFETETKKHISLIENHPRLLNDYWCDYDPNLRKLISSFSTKARNASAKCDAKPTVNG